MSEMSSAAAGLGRNAFSVPLLPEPQFLSHKQGIRMVIEKTMFDIRSGDDFDDPAIAAREPCIPDFILRSDSVPDGGAPVVVVETMGFASETYRSRKVVTHEIMASTLNAPVLTHDFHFPETRTQPERDRRFWRDVRWAVTGPTSTLQVRYQAPNEPHRDSRRLFDLSYAAISVASCIA